MWNRCEMCFSVVVLHLHLFFIFIFHFSHHDTISVTSYDGVKNMMVLFSGLFSCVMLCYHRLSNW